MQTKKINKFNEKDFLNEILNAEPPKDEDRTLSAEKASELYSKLQKENDEMFKNMRPDPITDEEYREMEAGPYEPLFDPGLGKMSIGKDIKAFYGKQIYYRLVRELEANIWTESHGQVSKELYHEMKCLREGIQPKNAIKKESSEPKKKKKTAEVETYQRERQPGDDYFHILERGVILNDSYRKIFSGPAGIIYQWLWAKIARKNWKDTAEYPLKKNYYDKGILACSMSLRYIAEKCWLNKATVKKHIDILENEGVIKVQQFVPKGKKRGQNIYILGKWKKTEDGKIREIFYRDQVYLSKQ